MTERELRNLRRTDLLELLLEQSKENERLRRELAQAKAQLEDRAIRMESTGSLAEAALALSGVFDAAQQASELYLENIRIQNQKAEDFENRLRSRLQNLCGLCPIWNIVFDLEQAEKQETTE